MNASSIRIETVEKTPGASPYTVHFKVLAPEDAIVASYSWCFGDGNTSTAREPTHTYYSDAVQGNDNYHAVLTVTFTDGTIFRSAPVPTLVKDKQGGQGTGEDKLLPIAQFTANRTSGLAPLDVKFTCQSEYVGSGYSSSGQLSQWYIDGTNVGQGKFLEYRFDAGEYNVTLVARNDNGTDSASKTITVTDPQLPTATVSFEANPMLGEAPLTVSFTDTSAVPYETSWIWDFGDGTPMVEYNQYIDHEYQTAGNYTVTLTHYADGVDPISATQTIVVTEPAGEKIYPSADFTLNVTSGPAPLLVEYHDQSLNATSVYWEFGLEEDQVASHETSPLRDGVVRLREPGNYTVRLTATNQNGTDTKLGSINVTDGAIGGDDEEDEDEEGNETLYLPDASFTASVLSGEEPLLVTFVNTSANTTSVEWFVDGIFITEEDEMDYIFLEPGDYNVTLVAYNGTFADQASETIVVGTDPNQPESYPPVADFSANQTTGEAPLSVQFTDESINATDVIWTFELTGAEAGESSFERDPVYTFTLPGSYTVTLYALNADGMDEKTMRIEVTKGQVVIPDPEPDTPIAQFDANVTQGVAPLSVEFTDLSVFATQVRWYVDGDYAGDGPELVYRFDQTGQHLVVLIASNGQLFSSASKIITVKDPATDNGSDDNADDEEDPADGGDDTDDQDDHADDGNNTDDNADDGSSDEGNDTDGQDDGAADDGNDTEDQDNGGDDGADDQDGHDADDGDKCPGENADEKDDAGCDEQEKKDKCSDQTKKDEPKDECADKKEDKCAPKPSEDKCIDKKEDKCAPKPTEDKCADIEEESCAPVDECSEQQTTNECEEQEVDNGQEQETTSQCDDQPEAVEETPVETPTEEIVEETPVESEECDDQQEAETPAPAPSENGNNSC